MTLTLTLTLTCLPPHTNQANEQKQRLADLVAADQRIFSGDEGCEEEEAARIEAESDAAQVA